MIHSIGLNMKVENPFITFKASSNEISTSFFYDFLWTDSIAFFRGLVHVIGSSGNSSFKVYFEFLDLFNTTLVCGFYPI